MNTDNFKKLINWQNQYISDRKYAGSSLLVHQGDQEVFFSAVGARDLERDRPFQRDTIVRLYSMTKPVTSLAVMMLVERGLLDLQMPVDEFLPKFKDLRSLVPAATRIDQTEPSRCPTIQELLTHTAGFSYPFNPGVLPEAMHELDLMFKPNQGALADNVAKLADFPLAFQPGTRWEYSVSIDVLGHIVELISNRSLEQFFREEILSPLGMDQTGFSVPHDSVDRFAALYTSLQGDAMDLNNSEKSKETIRLFDDPTTSGFRHTSLYSGGGGLVGTIDDYMKFANMLRNFGRNQDAQLVRPETIRAMTQNHLPGDIASMGPNSFAEQPMNGMGFGLGGAVMLDPQRAQTAGSTGDFSWGGMASTFFWNDPQRDMSVVFLTQLSPSSSYASRAELKALVVDAIDK